MRLRTILACVPLILLAACQRQVVEAWPDGSARRSGAVVDGVQTGPWVYRYQGGGVAAEGGFAHSMQDGLWTYRHENGTASARGRYVRGLKEGEWTYWRADGSRRASGSYAYDRQEGVWTSYAGDGRGIAALGWYSHGVAHGPWLEVGADGAVTTAGIQVAGVRVGPWTVAGKSEDCALPTGWSRRDEGGTVRLVDGGGAVVGVIAHAAEGLRLATPGRVIVCEGGARLALPVDDGLDLATVEHLLFGAPAVAAATAAASPPPPEATAPAASTALAPEEPTSMTSWSAAAAAPPSLPAGVGDDPLPAPGAAALEPVAILPGLWTTDQEAHAAAVVDRYRGDRSSGLNDYGAEPPPTVSRARHGLEGKPLPQTRFLGADGQVLDLKRWQGKRVAVVVMRGFSGQVCLYCAAQTAALAEAAPMLSRINCAVLVVYPGPADAVPTFLKAATALGGKPPELPVALDPGLHLVRKLELSGNLSLPATFVLDKDGIVRWTYIGTSIADRPSVRDIEDAVGKLPQ